MKKGLLIGCGSVFALFLLLGACVAVIGSNMDDTDTAADSTEQDKPKEEEEKEEPKEEKPEEPKDESGVTLANFEKIENGMSYEEVVDILGGEGELLSQAGEGEFKTEMYKWDGEGGFGANMNVTFQNGQVQSKAQMGLK